MKLLVVLLCLLSERFLIHSIAYQRFYWFNDYALSLKKNLDRNSIFSNNWLLLAGIVAPVVIIISLVYLLLHGILFGLIGFILNIVIFFYCLGPDNAFYPVQSDEQDETSRIGHYLAVVNKQLFAVIFWYVIAGPIAVLAYRMISLCRNVSAVSKEANDTAEVLEWLPARMTTLLYLLVGNFQRGIKRFNQLFLSSPANNDKMLSECGLLAVCTSEPDNELLTMTMAETQVEYSVIVLLVFIALFTILA